jgi:hypothetical protein
MCLGKQFLTLRGNIVLSTSDLSSRSGPAPRKVRVCCMGTDNESSM